VEFVGHIVGGMKSSTFRSRKATVSRARCAGALFCRKTKAHPGISRICMAVASQLLLGKKTVAIVTYAPFALTYGSINGFQCCQVLKRRL